MNVELSIAVYQRRRAGELSYSTLGLSDLNETALGRGAVKTQRRLVSALRQRLAGLEAGELERFQLRRGVRLLRVRLEVMVGEGTRRTRVSGVFPLIAEPRRTNSEQQIIAVYHPLRQDEWLFVEEAQQVPDAAQAFFRHAWKRLDAATVEDLRTDGKDGIKPIAFSATVRDIDAKDPDLDARGQRRRAASVLQELGANQTLRAIEGTLPLGMPRSSLRRHLWLLLGGTQKQSVVVVGPPKAGKSTLIAHWVHDLMSGEDYHTHHSLDRIHKVWRISGKRLIAGMSRLGDWEERCLDLLEEVRKTRAILWVDDIHLWGRLGQSRESERSFADFFHGPVARGELTLVGEATREQLSRLEDEAPSFAALLTRSLVPPASSSDTLQMLVHEGSRLELEARCRIHPFTYRTILEMSESLFPWTAFPGKAMRLLEGLVDPGRVAAEGRPRDAITPADVIALLSRHTGLPESLLTLDKKLDMDELRQGFESRVMGQTNAVDAACDLIARIRAGLTDPKRPYGVLLFTGPTGTGKTELAKQIAHFLYGDEKRLVRFDMSELASADAVARLIGDRLSPSGQLTGRIRQQPFSVLLLDEIEKAHRSVLHLLLQLFEDARLTDAAGDTTSFSHTVIIMTSNLGARPSRPMGFGDTSHKVLADIERSVAAFFPPELFNRIDRVVPFRPLSPEVAERVAVKELAQLFARRGMKERNIFVYAAATVKKRIVADAFDERWGARTVKRYLEEHIGTLLAETISRAGQASMQMIRLYEVEGEFRLHREPLSEVEPEVGSAPMESLLEASAGELRAFAVEVAHQLGEVARDLGEWHEAARRAPALAYYVDWFDRRAHELIVELGGNEGDVQAELDARSWAEATGVRLRLPRPRARVETRERLLAQIAEASFLAANVCALGDEQAHHARLELFGVQHGDEDGSRPASSPVSDRLMEHLVGAYAALLEVTGAGALAADGSRVTELSAIDASIVNHVVLDVAGFAVRRRVAGEVGSHIRRSAAREPEIVRVRVLDVDLSPDAHLTAQADALLAFETALETGAATLPENPAALLPALRTLNFNRPLRSGDSFSVEVEDFREGYAATLVVRELRHVLERLWLLRSPR